jgi:hypothetical protein
MAFMKDRETEERFLAQKAREEEAVLAAQADRFAGANREEKNRPAALGMTVGI